MSEELIYGRILTEQEELQVSGGKPKICVPIPTVCEAANGDVIADDTTYVGDGCPVGTVSAGAGGEYIK